MREIVGEAETLKVNIMVLTETKKKGTGVERIGNYIHCYSGVPKEERARRKMSILIHKKLKQNIINWDPISENIIKIDLNSMQTKIAVFGIY